MITTIQLRTLQAAERDGTLVIGGIDATPGVRWVVVKRLAERGYLRWRAPRGLVEHSEWVLTDLGRKLLGGLDV